MNARARVLLGLLAVCAANFLLSTTSVWFAFRVWPGREWVNQLSSGLQIGFVATLGLWLTFGDGKWYWRLVHCFVSIQVTAFSIASILGSPVFDETAAWWLMLVLLWMLLTCFATLWPWRRIRGLRLTWQHGVPQTSMAGQFHSRDLLLWTLAIASVLASFRALSAIMPDWSRLADFLVLMLSINLLAGVAMYVAYGRKRIVLQATALLILTLAVSAAFVTAQAWNQLQANEQAIPWQSRFEAELLDSLPASALCFGLTLLVLLNCLVLRALGCRLVQRSGGNHVAAARPESMV